MVYQPTWRRKRAQDSCGEALPAADGGDLAESNRKSKILKWRLCKGHVIVHYLQILGYKYKSDIFINTLQILVNRASIALDIRIYPQFLWLYMVQGTLTNRWVS